MKYALCLPNAGSCDPWTLGRLGADAEDAGWDAVFLEDYVVYQAMSIPTFDPWISLASIASSTRRVRIGLMVSALPRRRPWKLAAEAMSLDHLSQGRMILGAGLGDTNEPGFTAVGEALAPRARGQLVDESLEIIAGLWTAEPLTFEGAHYHVKGLTLRPAPLQKPRIPIWIGGGWPNPGVARRIARWDGSCAYKHPVESEQDMMPEDVREMVGYVAAARDGTNNFDIAVGGRQRKQDWERERAHIAALEAAGATWWMEWIRPKGLDETRSDVVRGPLRIE